MPFKELNVEFGFENVPKFFRKVTSYTTIDNSLYLLEAIFDSDLYTDDLFFEYNIIRNDYITKYTLSRKSEFLAGRILANFAISKLNENVIKTPIGYDGNGVPVWPNNVTGSISHTHNKVICAVANLEKYKSIGIDCERIFSDATAVKIIDFICEPSEVYTILEKNIPLNIATTMLFSSKESIYKAFYPLKKQYLEFKSARLLFLDEHKMLFNLKIDQETDLIIICQYSINFDNVITLVTLFDL